MNFLNWKLGTRLALALGLGSMFVLLLTVASLAFIHLQANDQSITQKLDSLINTTQGRDIFRAMSAARSQYGAARNAAVQMVQEGSVALAYLGGS